MTDIKIDKDTVKDAAIAEIQLQQHVHIYIHNFPCRC